MRGLGAACMGAFAVLAGCSLPAVAGNVIENSSFEVGTGHGWGRADVGGAFCGDKCFTTATAANGKHSVRARPLKLVSKWPWTGGAPA